MPSHRTGTPEDMDRLATFLEVNPFASAMMIHQSPHGEQRGVAGGTKVSGSGTGDVGSEAAPDGRRWGTQAGRPPARVTVRSAWRTVARSTPQGRSLRAVRPRRSVCRRWRGTRTTTSADRAAPSGTPEFHVNAESWCGAGLGWTTRTSRTWVRQANTWIKPRRRCPRTSRRASCCSFGRVCDAVGLGDRTYLQVP